MWGKRVDLTRKRKSNRKKATPAPEKLGKEDSKPQDESQGNLKESPTSTKQEGNRTELAPFKEYL